MKLQPGFYREILYPTLGLNAGKRVGMEVNDRKIAKYKQYYVQLCRSKDKLEEWHGSVCSNYDNLLNITTD